MSDNGSQRNLIFSPLYLLIIIVAIYLSVMYLLFTKKPEVTESSVNANENTAVEVTLENVNTQVSDLLKLEVLSNENNQNNNSAADSEKSEANNNTSPSSEDKMEQTEKLKELLPKLPATI